MSYKLGIYGPLISEAFSVYKRLGVDSVFTDIKNEIEAKNIVKYAKDKGFKVYACTWTFRAPNNGSENRFGVENVYGERSLWAGAGCPNNHEIRERSFEWIRNVLSNFDIDGVVLDGVRFPSPGSGLSAFLTCFCEYCEKQADRFGCDLLSVKKWLRGFRDAQAFIKASLSFPDVLDFQELAGWMDFRCRSITEFVRAAKEVAESVDQRAEVGATVFTPSLAPLVGQSYVDLASILDFLQPMIYHKGDGLACINFELGRLVGDFAEGNNRVSVLSTIYGLSAYGRHNPPESLKAILESGLPVEIVEDEVWRAQKLLETVKGSVKAKLTPIVFVVSCGRIELKEILRRVLDTRPDGIVLFNYSDGFRVSNLQDLRVWKL
jgi:hypothetical protein